MHSNSDNHDTVILVNSNGMGSAEPELGLKLIRSYLHLLNTHPSPPAAICFYNAGVKLVVDGSPVLAELNSLQDKGVHLISCLTCLDFFEITDRLQVGVIGGMPDILEAQMRASKTITL